MIFCSFAHHEQYARIALFLAWGSCLPIPIRKGQSEQSVKGHSRISRTLPAEQSRHLARIALRLLSTLVTAQPPEDTAPSPGELQSLRPATQPLCQACSRSCHASILEVFSRICSEMNLSRSSVRYLTARSYFTKTGPPPRDRQVLSVALEILRIFAASVVLKSMLNPLTFVFRPR